VSSPVGPLVGARSLSSFGRALISATVFWELFQRTHDNLIVSMVGLVQVIPVVLLFTWSGGLADRFDRRSLTTMAAAATGLIGLGLAAASYLDLPPVAFFVLLFFQGCVTSVHAPASSSLIPLIIERGELQRVNRIGSSLQELAQILGPGMAGLMLYLVDPHWIYAIVAGTGIASAALYRSLPQPRAVDRSAQAAGAARKDWRVGLRYIFRSPLLLPALTLDMFAVLFAGVTALLPALCDDVLHVGSLGYGVLRSAQSVGAVLAAVLASRLPPWKRPGRVLLIVVALFGAATVAFGLSTSFPLSVGLLVLCGALDNISVVIRLTLEQMVVPDAIRGRVSAVHYVFIGMSNELGGFESGAAAALVGTVPAIVGGGAIAILVVGFVAAKWRALSAMPPLSELCPAEESATP
jgi:MFS family permease